MPDILSANQRKILDLLGREKIITENFYWGGGAVLAELYLQHRLSEDLDFFSEPEVDPLAVLTALKSIQSAASIARIEHTQSFNRNLFFLEIGAEKIKTEFTYFPFARIEKGGKYGNLETDSLLDIAVNKVFTIYQKPRSRDFIDLYCILQKRDNWKTEELIKSAQIKFGTYLDPVQLGAQYLKAAELKDYPWMLIDLNNSIWQDFFLVEAKKLRGEIVE